MWGRYPAPVKKSSDTKDTKDTKKIKNINLTAKRAKATKRIKNTLIPRQVDETNTGDDHAIQHFCL